jgi:hypothetical protein
MEAATKAGTWVPGGPPGGAAPKKEQILRRHRSNTGRLSPGPGRVAESQKGNKNPRS